MPPRTRHMKVRISLVTGVRPVGDDPTTSAAFHIVDRLVDSAT